VGALWLLLKSQCASRLSLKRRERRERPITHSTRTRLELVETLMLACIERAEMLRAGPSTRLMLAQGRPLTSHFSLAASVAQQGGFGR
jgi:hypothetical protein